MKIKEKRKGTREIYEIKRCRENTRIIREKCNIY